MLDSLKRNWRTLRNGPPGKRFREHYRRRKKTRTSAVLKALFAAGGLFVIAIGVFFLPAPGPGLPIVFLGAAMLTGESYAAAVVFDWLELRGRKLATWGYAVWKDASLWQRALLVAVALLVTAAGSVAIWYVASCFAGH